MIVVQGLTEAEQIFASAAYNCTHLQERECHEYKWCCRCGVSYPGIFPSPEQYRRYDLIGSVAQHLRREFELQEHGRLPEETT
jgi:hypothetical protein